MDKTLGPPKYEEPFKTFLVKNCSYIWRESWKYLKLLSKPKYKWNVWFHIEVSSFPLLHKDILYLCATEENIFDQRYIIKSDCKWLNLNINDYS